MSDPFRLTARDGFRYERCSACGEKLIPIAVKGHPPILPSRCRCGHETDRRAP